MVSIEVDVSCDPEATSVVHFVDKKFVVFKLSIGKHVKSCDDSCKAHETGKVVVV